MEFEKNVKKVIPMIMVVFISSATMINVFNMISPQLTVDFGIDQATVSLLSMTAMLMMGVSSVAYSALSDYVSIKKLMVFGVLLLNIGAVMGYLVSGIHFYLLLLAAALMITGGTCGSGLMIITVTRYIKPEEHAKYYGFNTSCVSVSQATGVMLGGFFASYIGWKYAFLVPVISLAALPFLLRYLPDQSMGAHKKLDVVGLFLLTAFTFMISIYLNFGKLWCLGTSAILLLLFLVYLSKNSQAFIQIEFFQNKRFVAVILLVALAFGVQSGFAFLFSFMASSVQGISLDRVSLILLPSYVLAALVAVNSGKVVEGFGGMKTLKMALLLIILALLFGAATLGRGVFFLGLSACLFAGGYGLVYAPFMQLVIGTLKPEQLGAGIGFFNLMTSVGPSLLIVLTGKMMATLSAGSGAGVFRTILFVYAGILVLVLAILYVFQKGNEIGRKHL